MSQLELGDSNESGAILRIDSPDKDGEFQIEIEYYNENLLTYVNKLQAVVIRDFLNKFILEQPKEDKWISVKDKLPESDGNYLVCLKSGYIMASHFFPSHGTSWYFLGRNSVHGSNPVTHWQPLPEPPKED